MVATVIGLCNSQKNATFPWWVLLFTKLGLLMTSKHPHSHPLHPVMYAFSVSHSCRWMDSSLTQHGKRIDFVGNLTPASR